jgi:hypothetical protein
MMDIAAIFLLYLILQDIAALNKSKDNLPILSLVIQNLTQYIHWQ